MKAACPKRLSDTVKGQVISVVLPAEIDAFNNSHDKRISEHERFCNQDSSKLNTHRLRNLPSPAMEIIPFSWIYTGTNADWVHSAISRRVAAPDE